MMGKPTGMTFAPVAACSSFGYGLKLAMDAIQRGDAKAVVMGMTILRPTRSSWAALQRAESSPRMAVSKPLTALRGTHVAGGAVLSILGDLEHFTAKGFKPLGMEPLAVGVTADADHIITPSKEGPTAAIHAALAAAHCTPTTWGAGISHATATPGDFLEVETLRGLLPESVLVTARKGTFGHGMSAGGGWELTAQYLGYARGHLFPTPLQGTEAEPGDRQGAQPLRLRPGDAGASGRGGKPLHGGGGINACVISRPWR